MPELAEVEFYRRVWNRGIGDCVTKVAIHARKRIFRNTATTVLTRELVGTRLLRSEARGKRMLLEFSGGNWLQLHLGMTGKMWVDAPDFTPGKHDHLVLYQSERALVLRDTRQFGRVRFYQGKSPPSWWNTDVPEIASAGFTLEFLRNFLDRHRNTSIKAVLLNQSGFSGIGNWMADEILWRAKISPRKRARRLTHAERRKLFRATRFVARQSLRVLGASDSELPQSWLIHQRWLGKGRCPRHGTILRKARIGGRTTAWCPNCQH
jgi:formamidopyrimidine-DNA glycosylase